MKTLTNLYKYQLDDDNFHYGYLINETDQFLIIYDLNTFETLFLNKEIHNYDCKSFQLIFKDIPLEVILFQFDGMKKDIDPFVSLDFLVNLIQYLSGNQNLNMVEDSLFKFNKDFYQKYQK